MKGENAFDKWSWVHLASGFALGLFGCRFSTALAALLLFELFESGVRKPGGTGLFEHESRQNILADVVVGVLGYLLARPVIVVLK